jgi:hypothetical protein|tara:strand:- start:337 stop:501 length:165 start_codon:yes stop_codon:yes gene_type:complete
VEILYVRNVKMSKKYGSMGYTYKDFVIASGMSETCIMECVRFLEPIVEKMEKDD